MIKNIQRQIGSDKTARNPVKIVPFKTIPKPNWIKVKVSNSPNFQRVKKIIKQDRLHTVCEEATCPNIGECFGSGTATFMILGDLCTRRCPFCDVAHGRPKPPNVNEPNNLANAVTKLGLNYVVVTSVNRDDLKDGGAGHFKLCIAAIRKTSPKTLIEILTPDFRGRLEPALKTFREALPDIMNHNLETVPRLYKEARPGADYENSLNLLRKFKDQFPHIKTKSGLMVGLGETDGEIYEVMHDLKFSKVDLLTIGQYLKPTDGHLPVKRYVSPSTFEQYKKMGEKLGFSNVASGPLVRSSYHADIQAQSVNQKQSVI